MKIRPREKSSRIQVGQYAFTKKGVSRFDLRDPYHAAVTLTWPQFLLSVFVVFLCINMVFATLYTIVPGAITNARPGNFMDAFFFSVETIATVGYGEMYPGGLYGHLVSAAEIIAGISLTAILTGLTFVRFSRPRAKFIFADKLVMANYNGTPTLMVRVGNGRANVLSDAKVRLSVLLSEQTTEGSVFRRTHDLRLQRSSNPIFPLTWTLMHVVDSKSPLHGYDAAGLIAAEARMFLSFEAYDPLLSATVKEVRAYTPEDVVYGMRYSDLISTDDDGFPVADLTLISTLEPDIGPMLPILGTTADEDGEGA